MARALSPSPNWRESQFFLTRRSLYLLVLDARKGEDESRLHYWLKIIQSFGADAPVLVVINKIDEHRLELNEPRLTKDYAPNLRGFFPLSCATGQGLPELRQAIETEINALPHVYDEVPASYFAAKQALEAQARKRDFLEVAEYRGLCQKHGVTQERDQQILIRFLHDLGNVLHFDDPDSPYDLCDVHLLNPEWVTGGVYKIINNNELMQAGGVLEMNQLGRILTDRKCYPPRRHRFITGMMEKFELCFAFPDSRGQRLLIPELLSPKEPDLNWPESDTLNFEYHYDVLPPGLISRFIVKMQHHLTQHLTYWRSGVLLEIDGTKALVRADADKGKIFISIVGPERSRRGALAVIRNKFKEIHNTIPKIKAVAVVPMPDDPDVWEEYEHLLKMELRGIFIYLPRGANKEYSVAELLDGISDRAERQEEQETMSSKYHIQAGRVTVVEQSSGIVGDHAVQINRDPGRDAELQAKLAQLQDILAAGRREGVEEATIVDAEAEVKAIEAAAQQPQSEGVLEQAGKALRSLNRMAPDFAAFPTIATEFGKLVHELTQWWQP